VIGCEDRLRNYLYCVEWGLKLYSNQPTLHVTHGRGSVHSPRRCDMLCTSGFIDVVTYSHRGLYNGMSLPLQPMFFFWICWLQQRRCDVIHRLTPLLRVTGCLVSYATADIETWLLCRAGGAGDWIYNGCTIQPISNLHPAVKRITWSMHHEGLSMWRSEKASSARYNKVIQKAQLSPRDHAMRRVSWNPANCHATVHKLLVRQVLNQVSYCR